MEIADLLNDNDVYNARNADCSINVCGQTFNCHRLVVQLVSSHIQSLLENAADHETPIQLDLPEVTARAFEYVILLAYRGTVDLDVNVVGDVMTAADALSVPHLRVECVSFMTRTLCPENCLRYWSHLESYDFSVIAEQTLYKRCRDVARCTFWRAADSPRLLTGATDAIIIMLLRDDNLSVKNEKQVCEVLLKWFERRRANGNEVTESGLYLGLIRWSGIDAEYVRTTVVNHAAIRQSAESTSYLSRVITFQKNGMQFDGLQTWHRLTTKLERCILAIVSGDALPLAATMCAVSAQLTCSVEPRFGGDLPFSGTPLEAAATVVDSTMYVVGVGADNDQIWAYDTSTGWRRCCGGWGGLVAGRRRHSVVTVNGKYVYSVAGYCPRNRSLVSFVERFDPSDNRNIVVDGVDAVMPCPVFSAAAAVYNDDIYVFGGTNDENETINLVQAFNTSTGSWTTLSRTIPSHFGRLAAVLYNDRIIVISSNFNGVFNPETDDWTVGDGRRNGGGAGVSDFGLVVDNGRLYVLGGRRYNGGQYDVTDEVKSVELAVVCSDSRALRASDWRPHCRLPRPSFISAYCLLNIPSEV